MKVKVIGAGLAGCEAAYRLAKEGFEVDLFDIKPKAYTPAHSNADFGELVCSNSLKSDDVYGNACGLLKEEMRILGSLTMQAAEASRVPAGGALAVDRDLFARFITEKIKSEDKINIVCGEVQSVPAENCIVATGPLTAGALAEDIANVMGGGLHFYDASAPIVSAESIDMTRAFAGGRYGKGGDDYINCPMTKEEYKAFYAALTSAERADLHSFEKREIFEGCMPLEVMAACGEDTLRFGPFKPVGLRDAEGRSYYAVLQLRKENIQGSAYNLVGCQTNLKFGEQKRVFSLVPALKEAQFLRYGVMHRNTFINSPACLDADFSLRGGTVFFAGQITGVEGYVESAASGILAAIHLARRLKGLPRAIPPRDTVCGALSEYISSPNADFQPMNANYGLLGAAATGIRDKKERYRYLSERALKNIREYKNTICQ